MPLKATGDVDATTWSSFSDTSKSSTVTNWLTNCLPASLPLCLSCALGFDVFGGHVWHTNLLHQQRRVHLVFVFTTFITGVSHWQWVVVMHLKWHFMLFIETFTKWLCSEHTIAGDAPHDVRWSLLYTAAHCTTQLRCRMTSAANRVWHIAATLYSLYCRLTQSYQMFTFSNKNSFVDALSFNFHLAKWSCMAQSGRLNGETCWQAGRQAEAFLGFASLTTTFACRQSGICHSRLIYRSTKWVTEWKWNFSRHTDGRCATLQRGDPHWPPSLSFSNMYGGYWEKSMEGRKDALFVAPYSLWHWKYWIWSAASVSCKPFF